MRNRTAPQMVCAYQKMSDRLANGGIKPTLHILDNECSHEYKVAIEGNDMKYQLVPPHDHRRNVAEKAIQTFKDHLLSVLCGADNDFPLRLWCQILPQAEHQLNMLRKSGTRPTMSAFEHLHGKHNYDAQPFAILGCAVEMHVMPSNRRTWDYHTKSGYYLGTSWEHYRCHEVWIQDTKSTRIDQTVFFKHRYITQPPVTDTDALLRACNDICNALRSKPAHSMPTRSAMDTLMEILGGQAKKVQSPVDAQRVRIKQALTQKKATEDTAEPQRVPLKETGNQTIIDDDTATTTDETANSSETDGTLLNIVPPNEDELHLEGMEVSYPSKSDDIVPAPAIISQDDDIPARRTRASRRQALLSAVDISGACPTAKQAASRRFPLQFLVDFAGAVLDGDTGELLEYRHLIQRPKYRHDWQYSFGNEVGRLAQGMPGRNTGTNTIFFIGREDIPPDRWRDITYGKIVCNVRPQKDEVNRTRWTVGGDGIHINMDCGTPTASLLTVKLLLNSVVSTAGAKFMGLDLKDFYLNTPMKRPEFMRAKMSNFPDDVIAHYKLNDKVDNKGFVYVRCEKGMYGLPHAGIIAQNLLEKRLATKGYFQSTKTPGFWKHESRPICFSLIVDDFGVKYVGEEHANHLISVLSEFYTVAVDWKGEKYSGITLDWDYDKRQVHMSMPGYCKDALVRFGHKLRKPNDQPHKHTLPVYGRTIQHAKPDNKTPKLDADQTKLVQQITGTFLYYARAVDPTMLVALSAIASAQAAPTEETMEKAKYFLDYAASHPDAITTFSKSDMVLAIHSDASYLVESKARSRAGGHFFMSDNSSDPPNNGAVLSIAQIIKNVMTSAADAEIGALYINTRQAIPTRYLLEEMGHPQPPTPVQTDNTTALGFVTKNLQPKATKSTDMNHWFMRDRQDQKQFKYYWKKGTEGDGNDADYQTKHFCPSHHQQKRPRYLTARHVLDALRASKGQTPHSF